MYQYIWLIHIFCMIEVIKIQVLISSCWFSCNNDLERQPLLKVRVIWVSSSANAYLFSRRIALPIFWVQ